MMAAEKVHPSSGGASPVHHYPPKTTASPDNSSELPPVAPLLRPPPARRVDSPVRPTSRTSSLSDSSDGRDRQAQKPVPPGTYVIQLPKDQIFSYPPPGNDKKYKSLSNKKPRRSCCRSCLCYTIGILLIFILALAIAAGVLYLVFRPEAPNYTVSEIAIRGMNLTFPAPISPEFDVSIRANNKNKKLGIYYQSGSEVQLSYDDVILSNGVLPVFYQPSTNVTVFNMALKGSNVVLANAVRSKLVSEQKQGNMPFHLNVKAPVKIKVGAVKTWEITVKVKCDINVDAINEKSRIISRNCDYSVKLW